ncbi:MAG: 7-cyano-7-deazaguanine synthase QueC [Phycisphaerae bacterium]
MLQRPAIVLLSGGLDSTTCLAIARAEGFAPVYTLAFDYGQRHKHELAAAERVAARYGSHEHRVIHIDLAQFGGSALTGNLPVPKDRDESAMASDIPVTYVPARNTIFLAYALAWSEVLDVQDVYIGVNALDYSGYPDCRPEFITAFEAAAKAGTKRPRFTVHTPLIQLTKSQIVRRGNDLGIDYALTHSCYDPTTPDDRLGDDRLGDDRILACGRCDACQLRAKGFREANLPDPTAYAPR